MKRVVATQRILTPRGWRQVTDALSPRSLLYPTRSPASSGERCWFEREYNDVGEAAGDIAAICAGAAAVVALQAARAAMARVSAASVRYAAKSVSRADLSFFHRRMGGPPPTIRVCGTTVCETRW